MKLYGFMPPIAKLDASLSTLKKCKKLSLSTNTIDKITSVSGMDSLEILSLGRNNIKKIEGLDGVADTLKELWISYNNIEKLAGIEKLKALEILFMCAPPPFWSCRLPAAADAGRLVVAGRTTT